MSYMYRPFGLFFLLLMIVIGLQVALRKPLCIDSTIVYKIDKIGMKETDSLYSCNHHKKVKFSEYFFGQLSSLQSRMNRLELLMLDLHLTNKLVIVIDQIDLDNTTELLNGVKIGSALLASGNHLEKALLIKGIKNKTANSDQIFLETISDFLVSDGEYQNLISEAWNESFAIVGFLEKLQGTKTVVRYLTGPQNRNEVDTIGKLRNLASAISPHFRVNFDKKLVELGYYNEKDVREVVLDFVIEDLQGKALLSELAVLAKTSPSIKSAVKTASGLFLLPSFLQIPSVLESQIQARHRLVFNPDNNSNATISAFLHNTESLILIHSAFSDSVHLRPLYKAGVGEFLRQNKHLEFIQFHLPSYELVYKKIGGVANFFDFVRNKSYLQTQNKPLGWSRTEWLTEMRVYKPVANYDFVQYFRIN